MLAAAERNLATKQLFFYKPYAKQKAFHDAGLKYRERLFLAGNDLPRDHTSSESSDDWKARNTAHKADHEQFEEIKADLREAIEQAVGPHSNVAHRLSLYLRKHKDRIIDGLVFYRGEDNQGTATWSVRSVEG